MPMDQTILERTSQGMTFILICDKCHIGHEIGIKQCIQCQGKLKQTLLITIDQVKAEYRDPCPKTSSSKRWT